MRTIEVIVDAVSYPLMPLQRTLFVTANGAVILDDALSGSKGQEAEGNIAILTKNVDDALNAQEFTSSVLERANEDNKLLREDASSSQSESLFFIGTTLALTEIVWNLNNTDKNSPFKNVDLEKTQACRENTNQFTIAWHYGGRFFVKPNNLKYEHGQVEYMDFVEVDDFKKLTVDRVARFMIYLGYKLLVGVLYMRERMSLLNGLV
ncbi:hypothetical protein Fot_32394 [Forsythia ovata]|uniref:PB1-like domain-containing protein n=1 Tax=Forsythia ovata TaxID=205694 RepID=A0ABD1T7Q2_9LAMI